MYLSMIQVNFKPLLRFWVRLIQALPNSVKPFLIFWVLFPNSPNIHRIIYLGNFKSNKCFFMSYYESPNWLISMFYKENRVFNKKTFSNLVSGDDFTSTRTIWMYHDHFLCFRNKIEIQGSQYYDVEWVSSRDLV